MGYKKVFGDWTELGMRSFNRRARCVIAVFGGRARLHVDARVATPAAQQTHQLPCFSRCRLVAGTRELIAAAGGCMPRAHDAVERCPIITLLLPTPHPMIVAWRADAPPPTNRPASLFVAQPAAQIQIAARPGGAQKPPSRPPEPAMARRCSLQPQQPCRPRRAVQSQSREQERARGSSAHGRIDLQGARACACVCDSHANARPRGEPGLTTTAHIIPRDPLARDLFSAQETAASTDQAPSPGSRYVQAATPRGLAVQTGWIFARRAQTPCLPAHPSLPMTSNH